MSKFGENEGFEIVVIPSVTIKTCYGCKYYENALVKSGRDPIYENRCLNVKDMSKYLLQWGKRIIPSYKENGYLETPEWCPYLVENKSIEDLK